MENENNFERYNKLNTYLKKKFGERTLKICIDGNFSCPNRDGKISKKGCIYCSQRGSGDHLFQSNISIQVKNFLNSYRGERANKFIAYFQNFTNTYDSIENLRTKYNSALIDSRIVGLQIATRPDCINEEICQLLKEYSKNYYVCVELGLQTANEETAKFINRGYKNSVFTDAVNMLNKYNIDIIVHIMIGLPNENLIDLENTVNFLNKHNYNGLKIHNVYIVKNTILEQLYLKGQYSPIEFEDYMEKLVYVIKNISPDIIIHRISGDSPKDLLVAPKWNIHKKWVLNGLDKILKENNWVQGDEFQKNKRD